MRKNKSKYHDLYYKEHKTNIKEYHIKYIEENYEWKLWHSAKNRALKNKLEFSIKIDDIKIPEYCPFLNVKLTKIQGNGKISTNASIDRIDNSKGYTQDNIQIISHLANRMKQNATPEQLITFANNILCIYR